MSHYNPDLDRYVKESHSIPYRLHVNARYRNNCYYWSSYWSKWFKVIEAEYDFSYDIPKFIGAEIRWSDGGYGYTTSDLTKDDFRIELDNEKIYRQDIFNNDQSYTGAEVEYWFFMHPEEDELKRLFDPYLHGVKRLDPVKYYFLYYSSDFLYGKKKVRVVHDVQRVKFSKKKEEK